jgi:DNA repair photolyase
MNLEGHLLALLGDVKPGDELIPGFTLLRVSAELGWRVTMTSRDGTELQVEIEPARDGRRFAARTNEFHLSYRSLSRSGAVDPIAGRAACEQLAARVARHESSVLSTLRREADEQRAQADRTRIREVEVSHLLDPMGTDAERFYGLSPYVGCLIGCRFCYAQSRLGTIRQLEQIDDVPWGSYVDVRINAAEVLARELTTLPAAPIKFCPIVSDPYHAVEAKYRVTRACLEALRDAPANRGVAVLTRSSLVERDIDVLAAIPLAHGGASIPTADDEVRRHFEPRAASVTERFAMLGRMKQAGVRTFAVVQPILPGSLETLADALAAAVSSVRIDVLHGTEGAGDQFADRYGFSTDERWQSDRAHELAEMLALRGVDVWPGELPPGLRGGELS